METKKINERIELIRIETKKEFDVKTGTGKKGDWKMYPVSIKSGDVYYNASFFNEEEINKFRELKIDKSIYLKIWEEEYQGKQYQKFSFLNKSEQLEIRLVKVEKFMSFMLESQPELKEMFNKF